MTLAGRGAYVPREGYEPDTNRLPVLAEEGQFQPGRPLALVSATGEALYVPALAGVQLVDHNRGVWELDLGEGCTNPLLWTGNMRAYPAEALTVAKSPDGLRIQGTALGAQRVLALRDFAFRYVYAGVDGEQVYPDYRGASLPDGSRLVALAFMSVSGGEASRAFTARLPVEGTGTVRVTKVTTCGETSFPPGTGLVTVVVDPAPPGGGDLTLAASSYVRDFRATTTFRDVPEGEVRVEARDVWTDPLTAWAPDRGSQSGTLHSFAPLTFVVRYSIVPGTITFSASGVPADGSATVSAGPYSATLGGGGTQSVSATPGVYATSASPEVAVSRSQGSVSWTEVYTLQSLSPAQATVRSYDTVSVAAAYSGPLPGTLCHDGDCKEAPPGRYAAPGESVVRTWTSTYTRSCPPGQTGSVTVTEEWRTVKYWTPGEGGLSSRGTLSFGSATRDEMVSSQEQRDCTPMGTLNLTAVLATALGGDPNPDVQAQGSGDPIFHRTWSTASYSVPAGVYSVTANRIFKEFTRYGLTYRADYTAAVSSASVAVPAGGTASATATYTVVPGTFCDFHGCQSVPPGIHYPSGGDCRSNGPTYDSTDLGTYYYIVRISQTECWFAEYSPLAYPVSSNETVRATGVQSPWLITSHRYTLERKEKPDGPITTIIDILQEARWRYDDFRGHWEVYCSKATDYVAGTTTTSPDGCW